ncbi:MAG TPA: RsmB/NOP family class I SAM-dependent RNA methyltransferase [Spirochaetota bacterium]|nr:RsmB/NOP family class I SAM-dependent RNA methyltransferase [Spirochaetota bacterium]
MISLDQLRSKLPKEALDLLQETFEPAIYNSIILSFREKRKTTFRVNVLKSSKNEVMERLKKENFKFSNIEYIDNGFILLDEDEKRLLKSTLVLEGKIYLQSISSLLPPLILEPNENEKILDIAASPGSKTTQIAGVTNNKSLIDALEPDFIRMERLKHNVNLLGATSVTVHHCEGQTFCKEKENYYDKILVDAPCSGEGRFNIYDKNSYGNWKLKNVEKLSNLQKKLLRCAIKSLKPNGILVYSTCTLNIFENEAVVNEIIKDNDINIKILPIEQKFKNLKESVIPMLNHKNNRFDKSILNCLRIIPSKNLEGFFICKMQKIT